MLLSQTTTFLGSYRMTQNLDSPSISEANLTLMSPDLIRSAKTFESAFSRVASPAAILSTVHVPVVGMDRPLLGYPSWAANSSAVCHSLYCSAALVVSEVSDLQSVVQYVWVGPQVSVFVACPFLVGHFFNFTNNFVDRFESDLHCTVLHLSGTIKIFWFRNDTY
jgi:hypothetical protein